MSWKTIQGEAFWIQAKAWITPNISSCTKVPLLSTYGGHGDLSQSIVGRVSVLERLRCLTYDLQTKMTHQQRWRKAEENYSDWDLLSSRKKAHFPFDNGELIYHIENSPRWLPTRFNKLKHPQPTPLNQMAWKTIQGEAFWIRGKAWISPKTSNVSLLDPLLLGLATGSQTSR